MRGTKVTFPAVVAIIDDTAEADLLEKAVQQIGGILQICIGASRRLTANVRGGVTDTKKIIEFAKELGINCRPFVSAAGSAMAMALEVVKGNRRWATVEAITKTGWPEAETELLLAVQAETLRRDPKVRNDEAHE